MHVHIYINIQTNKLFGTLVVVAASQIPFLVMYTQTVNIVNRMVITTLMTIGVSAVLYWLNKLDQQRQKIILSSQRTWIP